MCIQDQALAEMVRTGMIMAVIMEEVEVEEHMDKTEAAEVTLLTVTALEVPRTILWPSIRQICIKLPILEQDTEVPKEGKEDLEKESYVNGAETKITLNMHAELTKEIREEVDRAEGLSRYLLGKPS